MLSGMTKGQKEFERMCEALRATNPDAVIPAEISFDVGMMLGYIEADMKLGGKGAKEVIDSLKSAWVKSLLSDKSPSEVS